MAVSRCSALGCNRSTTRGAGNGLSPYYCRYHIAFRARHGSLWHASYNASDLKPYQKAARRWLKEHGGDLYVAHAFQALEASMDGAGEAEIATRLKGLSARRRARIAFARLREAAITPERLLSIYLAVCGLMQEDAGAHRVEEFRVVQVAKAVHRLASGYHRRWHVPLPSGETTPIVLHKYPRSSGLVLRVLGREIERCCELVAHYHLDAILKLKNELFGPHPSSLPGWLPEWRKKMDAARSVALRA